jgi:hypothetical protein
LKVPHRRRGVAAVIGTLFFVLVFMLALGASAYASSLQGQAAQAQMAAQQTASRRGSESIVYASRPTGLAAVDVGPSGASINHIVLRFPNGTAYLLSATALVPAAGSLAVRSIVPSGVCTPGAATCLSKYDQIVSGNPPGSSVGLVTSLGNVFWYVFTSGQVGRGSTNAVLSSVSTSGTGGYVSTGLTAALSSSTTYAFYAYTAMSPGWGGELYNFEVHALPAGAALVIACTPASYPIGGGNQPTNCVRSTGTPIAASNSLGFTVLPPVFSTPGVFGTVTTGASGGTLQIDFACLANCGYVTMNAGSFLIVQPVG